ncbi:MAG: hypothetical protein WC284_12030 [Candidimonas sp.]
MFITEILNNLSDAQRHEWIRFIHKWLSGSYMGKKTDQLILQKWKEFKILFPHNEQPKYLYRLITIPKDKIDEKIISMKPSPYPVSSWSGSKRGIDFVAGLAREFEENISETARVVIKASIPSSAILATKKTISKAILELTHDYFEKYPEYSEVIIKNGERERIHGHRGWPEEDEKDGFTRDDVGDWQWWATERGGPNRQNEYVVETPENILCEIVDIYRIGDKDIKIGHDDPINA